MELKAGQAAPTDGLLLSIPEVRALDRILADLDGRAKIAEAANSEITAKLNLALAQLKEAEIRLAGAVATIEVEKAKRPSWIESHIGGCLGVGAAYDGEVSGGIVLGYGWKF